MATTDTTPGPAAQLLSPPREVRRGRAIPVIAHHTPAEHAALGESARKRVSHDRHAAFEPELGRDPVALIESQAPGRVPELVPIRYGRMMVSPFTFYRGAALVMAHDLAAGPTSGLTAQLCGDAHVSNFGLFASPERRLVFDINDFDETCPGPWEWDLKRLTASFTIAGREIGLSTKERRSVVRNVASGYRTAMAEFAGMRDLDIWYAHVDVADIQKHFGKQLRGAGRKKLTATVSKARTR